MASDEIGREGLNLQVTQQICVVFNVNPQPIHHGWNPVILLQ